MLRVVLIASLFVVSSIAMVSQKSIDEAASKKAPVIAYFDNRFVNELDKEGFFKKLWQ